MASPSPSPSPVPSPSPSPTGFSYKIHGVGSSTASGTITVTPDAATGNLTIEVAVTGLQAASSHVSHMHLGSCEQPGPILFALSQVVADGQGNADAKTVVKRAYPPTNQQWYVVVHQGPDMQGANAAYLMCGDLA